MTNKMRLWMESRIHGDVYVRFGGRLSETYHRKVERRRLPSLRVTDVKISTDMNSFAEKLEEKRIKSKCQLDKLFECLSLVEKMALFNLPSTLSNDPERVKRMSVMWHSLSNEEKTSLWSNAFENKESHSFKPHTNTLKIAVNQ